MKKLHNICLKVILKLKQIITSVSNMHSSYVLNDAFGKIVEETCNLLLCERASVFLIDPKKKELWTKVAKGVGTIRVPLSSGLVGYVARTKERINILDAHLDDRFNKDVDIKNNFRTKSVLCIPILDATDETVLGISYF